MGGWLEKRIENVGFRRGRPETADLSKPGVRARGIPDGTGWGHNRGTESRMRLIMDRQASKGRTRGIKDVDLKTSGRWSCAVDGRRGFCAMWFWLLGFPIKQAWCQAGRRRLAKLALRG